VQATILSNRNSLAAFDIVTPLEGENEGYYTCLGRLPVYRHCRRPTDHQCPELDCGTTQCDHGPESQSGVATTSNANDSAAPAQGSNSFTEGQAKDRIAQRGYTNVAGLKKDDNGVWHGTAQHGGNPVQVWLDYKGNVGEAR